MIKEKQSAEELIASLSDELVKVKVMPHPLLRTLPWFLIATAYMVIVISIIGLRTDIDVKINDNGFVYELLHIFAISISAALCSSWLCVPDMRGRSKWIIAIPVALLAIFILEGINRFNIGIIHNINMSWHHCYGDALVFSAVPAFAILAISIKGNTTHPYLMSLMNSLSVGALGYAALRLTCSSDDIAHLSSMHIIPYLLFGIIIAALGRNIYRW